jgi:hypothetical protein
VKFRRTNEVNAKHIQ